MRNTLQRMLNRQREGESSEASTPKPSVTPNPLRTAVMQLLKRALGETDIPASLHASIVHFTMKRTDSEMQAMATQLVSAADALRPHLEQFNREHSQHGNE